MPGDEVVGLSSQRTGETIDVDRMSSPEAIIDAWRSAYRMGLRGPVTLRARAESDGALREVTLDRPPAWMSGPDIAALWAKRHLGMIAQIVVFVGAAMVLVALRASDLTAAFAVLALTLCAVGGGGPLMGSEAALPRGLREVMTLFAWVATPVAFPFTALAILYFPTRAHVVTRRPWVQALPFAAAAPMIVSAMLTGLFLVGFDAFRGAAIWDARNGTVYYLSFAAALAFNVWAIIEGIGRYKSNRDADERRRIQLAVYTAVPGVFAYALKDGIPLAALLATGMILEYPWWVTAALQILVLLPAVGLAYSVAVHRVLGPRMVLRTSVQYALARKTLAALAIVPAVALVLSLFAQRDQPLSTIVRSNALFDAVMLGVLVAALKYREKARAWLDRRFFREAYDAQKILLSLASKIPYETDPNELTSLVLGQIDRALHPEMVAIMVSGVETGHLTPVSVLHGSADSLPLDGGLVSMLRWSEEALDIDLKDSKSPTRRLPASEREWLDCTGASLIVPVSTPSGNTRSLVGALVLGRKRSEEAYTAEDRQMLTAVAAQLSLALDVARLRSRVTDLTTPTSIATVTSLGQPLVAECPTCGRCEDAGTSTCPDDGAVLHTPLAIPRVIDSKYRNDQLIGRGGMGAVYRARDLRLDRDVAVKVVRAELLGDPEARSRFRREAQIVARLQHPSVVSIFDYGTLPDGGAYLVMEYVRGEDLRHAIRRIGRFTPADTVRLVSAICAAIEAAHREGILHRDLKPENVLLSQSDVEVKVLDFGVAKLVGPSDGQDPTRVDTLTVQGQIVGTPAYMAPEQLRAGALDTRTDVFSLGVLAYEMLTGELPFGRASLIDIAMRQASEPPSMSRFGVGPALGRVVGMALQHDPAKRPPSPASFASSLRAALDPSAA
jgi:tRNA A-37 threonylcarbamoyl transferase component Bud32